MGFLNHATNNIIVDAVLTEKGREVLSRNDGTFSIESFRLGDDEVDYSILEQYGIVIGKEKIEKNTPIFEAITDETLALKYPLRSFSTNNTEDISAIPKLILDSTLIVPVILSSNSSSSKNLEKEITVKTYVDQDETFALTNEALIDTSFTVSVNKDLLKITGATTSTEDKKGNKVYTVTSRSITENFTGQRAITFSITAKGVVNLSTYKKWKDSSDENTIKTTVTVRGNNTGAVKVIPVEINNNIVS